MDVYTFSLLVLLLVLALITLLIISAWGEEILEFLRERTTLRTERDVKIATIQKDRDIEIAQIEKENWVNINRWKKEQDDGT